MQYMYLHSAWHAFHHCSSKVAATAFHCQSEAAFAPNSPDLLLWECCCVYPRVHRSNKVIGCRYFCEGFGGPERVKTVFPFEQISCR